MSKPGDLPRRLGEILTPSLDKLAGSDEARAYVAWARAVGEPVARGTRPKAFRRGQLTVECASSVWANELTYLGPQILRRMDEVAPGHPVQRFRFVVGRLPGSAPGQDRAERPSGSGAAQGAARAPAPRDAATDSTAPAGQESAASTAKEERRERRPAPDGGEAARAQAEGVADERLRAAIEAALRQSSEEPPGAPGAGTPSG